MNSSWFRRELNREARGAVVHELVHVVQSYGRVRRTDPDATRAPGWLVEGIADYIRWFLYEPETRGAEINERNLSRARYDASYRVTGTFSTGSQGSTTRRLCASSMPPQGTGYIRNKSGASAQAKQFSSLVMNG
jgi:hypothetical protein